MIKHVVLDLMEYLPYYYQKSEFVQELQSGFKKELDISNKYVEDFLNQFFISTATWGLSIWEKELGLTINEKLSYQQRRERIIAKLRGRGTTTVEMIKRTAESFSGGEVEIIEKNEEYRFIVHFVGTVGVPSDMDGFKVMIDTIKPAHLNYSFKYTYLSWGSLKNKKWDYLKDYTWQDVLQNGSILD